MNTKREKLYVSTIQQRMEQAIKNITLTLLACIGLALTAAAQDYDLVILNGR